MSMPQDAITALLALNPSHLWVMNETSGSTFADSVTPGGTPLTPGTGVKMNWGTTAIALGGFGGPGTPAPRFDGSSNANASISGKTLGGLAQWSLFAWVEPETPTLTGTIYAEGSASSTDHLAIRWNASTTYVNYKDAGHTVQSQSGSSASSGLGAGLFGVTSDGTGNIRFYKTGAPAYASLSTGFPTTPSSWTDTVNTYVGFDPQGLAGAFAGMIGWICTVPTYVTEAQIYALNKAISPDPPNTHTWSRSASGAVFPNSELWNSKLPANAHLDPNGFSKVANWASVNAGTVRTALGGGGMTMVDVNRAGGTMTNVKDGFTSTIDQVAFLGQVNTPVTTTVEAPQPVGGGNDSLGAGVELDRGRVFDIYLGSQLGPTNQVNRHPQWTPYVYSTSTSASGTLAPGWYIYYMSVVTASGKESGVYGYGASATVNLTATGAITLTAYVDKSWSDAPVSYNIYRRGPYSTSSGGTYTDFGLLTTVAASSMLPYTSGGHALFVDNGSLPTTDTAKKPILVITAAFTLTVSGTNASGQNILTLRSNPNAYNHPTYGIPSYPLEKPFGPITLGTGATQESVFITGVLSDTQVQLSSNLAFTHNDGESFGPITNPYGASGYALGPEISSRGGGGSWDWYNNATFNPTFSPSGFTNNGESASSRPAMAGTITAEEVINANIPHPMCIAMYTSILSINRHWWPAARNDGASISTALSMWGEGMRMRLPAGFNENSITNYTTKSTIAAAFQKAFVVCMRDYGAIICDGSPGGLFYIENTSSEVGRADISWAYGGLSAGTNGVTSILDFMFRPGVTIAGNITQGSATVTGVSSFTGVAVGGYIVSASGSGVPYLTTISAIDTVGGTITLSQPAIATQTGISLYLGLMYQIQVVSAFRYPAKTDAFATFTATGTSGSNTLTSVSSFTGVYPGLVLTDPSGIAPHNATVVSINTGAGTLVMSQNAAASGTAVTFTAGRRTNKTSVGTLNTPGFQQLVPY